MSFNGLQYGKDAAGIKFVVIGGGSGTSAVLRGLKGYTSQITAIVTMFDSGGSSGLLQREFGYPPLGDLRQCLVGLSEGNETTKVLQSLLNFRFQRESSLKGHSMGNLLLAALTTMGSDLEKAIAEMSQLLQVTGSVAPVTLAYAELCARLEDGSVLNGESAIDLRGQRLPKIQSMFLHPSVPANPRAVSAILDADVVVLGPGDLYTSVIPNLLVDGVPQALSRTKALRVYVCNLMTKLGETDGFRASDFVQEILSYMGGPNLDYVVVNTGRIPDNVVEVYAQEQVMPVEADMDVLHELVPHVVPTSLANNSIPLRHNSYLLAEALLRVGREQAIHSAGILSD